MISRRRRWALLPQRGQRAPRSALASLAGLVITLNLLLAFTLTLSRPALSFETSMRPVTGDLKLFYFGYGPPRGWETLPVSPLIDQDELAGGGSGGILTTRLKLKGRLGALSWEAHPLFSAQPPRGLSGGLSLNPNASGAVEAIPLSADLIDLTALRGQLRADRLLISTEIEQTKFTLGRQAISLGQGRVFTPLDRVTPFSPTAIDQEYTPGVDAARVDLWWGVAGQLSLIGAYRGAWSAEGLLFALDVRQNIATFDLSLTLAQVQGDHMVGASFIGPLGALTVYGDLTWTWGDDDLSTDPSSSAQGENFARTSLGLDCPWRAGGGGAVMLEAFWQGDGVPSPQEYLQETSDPRLVRGERWLLGRAYAALNLQQSLTALLKAGVSVIGQLDDRSLLMSGSLSWSISDEASAMIGGYFGAGDGLAVTGIQSEFGALSWVGFAMMSAYY